MYWATEAKEHCERTCLGWIAAWLSVIVCFMLFHLGVLFDSELNFITHSKSGCKSLSMWGIIIKVGISIILKSLNHDTMLWLEVTSNTINLFKNLIPKFIVERNNEFNLFFSSLLCILNIDKSSLPWDWLEIETLTRCYHITCWYMLWLCSKPTNNTRALLHPP